MIKIFLAGDVVPIHRTTELFRAKETAALFGEIMPYINKCQLKIVNLEAPILLHNPSPIPKSGPHLAAFSEAAEVLKQAGFNIFTLANNHFRDHGDQGVEDTLEVCRALGVKTVGGGVNLQEARRILYSAVDGKTIAIINACEHEFTIATEGSGGSNPLSYANMYSDIPEARRQSDFVLVIIHGGVEHFQYPTPRMKEAYRLFVDFGADVVVNHHQHCFSGYEEYKGKPIFYGLGNFCFDRVGEVTPFWSHGYSVMLHIDESITFSIIPHEQCSETPNVHVLQSDAFNERLAEINRTIQDDIALKRELSKFSKAREKGLLMYFLPVRNRILYLLLNKGLISKIFYKQYFLLIKNLFACEAHHDVMTTMLEGKINEE